MGKQGLCHCILITKRTQTPFPQTDHFLLVKARAKTPLSCHQDSWFISSPPSFHISLDTVPTDSPSPRRSCLPQHSGSGKTAFAGPAYFHLFLFCFFSLVRYGAGWRTHRSSSELEGRPGESTRPSHGAFATERSHRVVTARPRRRLSTHTEALPGLGALLLLGSFHPACPKPQPACLGASGKELQASRSSSGWG